MGGVQVVMCSLQLTALFASVGVASGILAACNQPKCFATELASSHPKGSISFEVDDTTGCVEGGIMWLYSPITQAQQAFTVEDCNSYTGSGYVITCQASYERFPYGLASVDPPVTCGDHCTQVHFENFGATGPHGDVALTTLAAPWTTSGTNASLMQVTDQAGCKVNGRMYLLDNVTSPAFADVVIVQECNVQFNGLSYVRVANPLPSQNLPATTHVAFFEMLGCPADQQPSCFTDEGLVQVEGAARPMALAELQEGDRVFDGVSYTNVIGFLHELNSHGNVVCIEHVGGELRVSPLHLLFARGGEKEARDIQVGDELLVSPGRFAEVLSIRTDKTEGFKAPLTVSGSINVDGTTASNYAAVSGLPLTHAAMHAALFPARVLATFFDNPTGALAGEIAEKTNAEAQHPLVDLYVKVLKLDDALRSLQ